MSHKALTDTTRDLLDKNRIRQTVYRGKKHRRVAWSQRECHGAAQRYFPNFERSRDNASLSAFLQEVSLVSGC